MCAALLEVTYIPHNASWVNEVKCGHLYSYLSLLNIYYLFGTTDSSHLFLFKEIEEDSWDDRIYTCGSSWLTEPKVSKTDSQIYLVFFRKPSYEKEYYLPWERYLTNDTWIYCILDDCFPVIYIREQSNTMNHLDKIDSFGSF